MSTDEPTMSCYDCDRTFPRRDLQTREVVVTHEDRSGYNELAVPLCRDCIGQRFGFDCPQCGITHDEKDDAIWCCRRRPEEAPDCTECGRRMKATAKGYDSDGPHVTVAECECCPVMWGAFTGWGRKDDAEPCEHVDVDPRGEPA